MIKGKIHSFESLGTVDGPGIRFVVFMQGCPMRCVYCHNPDTWGIDGGKEMSVDEILHKYEGVKAFCRGGITLTGGEPLLQIEFVTELFKAAKDKGIHTCIDTSGVTFSDGDSRYEELIKYTDLVMLDIKHINTDKHKELTAWDNDRILSFAKFLDKNNVPVWIRHVVVPTITDNEKDLWELGYFIGSLKNVKALDVLPYHSMGKVKYENLGLDYPLKDVPDLDKEKALEARKIILDGIRKRRNK